MRTRLILSLILWLSVMHQLCSASPSHDTSQGGPRAPIPMQSNRFDSVPLPNPSRAIDPQRLTVIDRESQDLLLKYFDSQLKFYSILITVVISVVGIFVGLFQFIYANRREKQIEDQFKYYTSQKDQEFEKLRIDFSKHFPTIVSKEVEELFNDRFRKEIFEITRNCAYEALMLEPSVRDLTQARLRRALQECYTLLRTQISEEFAGTLYDLLANAIADLHTLAQLCSPDLDQMRKGLMTFNASPFAEAKTRIESLQKKFGQDPTVFPLIDDAVNRIDEIL